MNNHFDKVQQKNKTNTDVNIKQSSCRNQPEDFQLSVVSAKEITGNRKKCCGILDYFIVCHSFAIKAEDSLLEAFVCSYM